MRFAQSDAGPVARGARQHRSYSPSAEELVAGRRLIVVNSEHLGDGSEELGAKLMGSFLRKLSTADSRPEVMLFYNSGVKLLAEGSHVLDALTTLSKHGVDLVACGTCAGFYGVTEKMVVGRISDMAEVVGQMLESEATVTV
jgi:selenium metabolism protein YedF